MPAPLPSYASTQAYINGMTTSPEALDIMRSTGGSPAVNQAAAQLAADVTGGRVRVMPGMAPEYGDYGAAAYGPSGSGYGMVGYVPRPINNSVSQLIGYGPLAGGHPHVLDASTGFPNVASILGAIASRPVVAFNPGAFAQMMGIGGGAPAGTGMAISDNTKSRTANIVRPPLAPSHTPAKVDIRTSSDRDGQMSEEERAIMNATQALPKFALPEDWMEQYRRHRLDDYLTQRQEASAPGAVIDAYPDGMVLINPDVYNQEAVQTAPGSIAIPVPSLQSSHASSLVPALMAPPLVVDPTVNSYRGPLMAPPLVVDPTATEVPAILTR